MKKNKFNFISILFKFAFIIIFFSINNLSFAGVNSGNNLQDEKVVTGVVKDETGVTIPGATIMVPGTTIGTITDIDGKFSIKVPAGSKTIEVRNVGYTTETVDITVRNHIEVTLETDVTELAEVVVTGYGQTQNEELVTSSITMIEPEVLVKDKPTARLEQAIQGQSPAVVVIKESGSPGATQTVRIRGIGTAGDATPLMLLDGFQLPDMDFINPNDIGNVGIFKDAAASAIYGARGGNGVLNIQSKSYKYGQKKIEVDYTGYFGIQSLESEGDYMNTQEYVEYYNASIDYMIRTGTQPASMERGKYTPGEISKLPNTTWIKEVTEDAPITDHHLAVKGGNKKTNFYLGTGIFDQGGLLSSTSFNRKSAMLKVNHNFIDRIDVSVLGNYTINTRRFIEENSENSRLLSSVASLPPIYPAYTANGDPYNNGIREGISYNGVVLDPIGEFGNPVVGLDHTTQEAITNIGFVNGLAKITIFEGLKFNTSFGYLSQKSFTKRFSDLFNYPEQQIRSEFNSLSESDYDQTYLQWEGYFNYEKQFGEHDISAVVGHSILRYESKSTGKSGRGFTENTFDDVDFDNIENDSSINESVTREVLNTTVSYYSRVNYNLAKKYLLGLTLRADASSKFGPDNKWGFFPSVNVGWNISNEPFLESSDLIDLLKLRASWGINGNDRIDPYQHYNRYYLDDSGLLIPRDINTEVKWEEVAQTNIGLDIDLWRNKLGFTIDYYIKETEDMLIEFPNPSFTSRPAPWRNAATVRNKGLEFDFTYKNKIGENLKLTLRANLGFTDNEVTDLGGGLPMYGANTRVFEGAPDLSASYVGVPVASFYGFKFDGVDELGNPVYKDISGPDGVPDGKIDADYDRTVIGNPYPDMIYGGSVKVEYKGFDLSVFVSGVEGNDVVNASTGYHVALTNRTRRDLDAWSLENKSSNVMRPSLFNQKEDREHFLFSDYYIEDGSYLRVKNITLGYNIPSALLEKVFISSARVYVSGSNLWTFTDYSGYDPEIGSNSDPRDVGVDRGFYPQARTIIGGVQVSF